MNIEQEIMSIRFVIIGKDMDNIGSALESIGYKCQQPDYYVKDYFEFIICLSVIDNALFL